MNNELENNEMNKDKKVKRETKKDKKRKFIKKVIQNAIIFILFVFITFYVVFKDNNINDIFVALSQVNVIYILAALICMFAFVFCEGLNIRRTLVLLGNKVSLLDALKYGFVGFFFSSVTPSSSGGQPMQLYYMKKDKLPISHSTLALLIELSSFQFTTIIIALIGFITNYNFLTNSIGNIKYLLIFGIVLNMCILALLLITIFSKKLIKKIVKLICRILIIFKYSKVDSFKRKCIGQINDYKNGAELVKQNKLVLLKMILTSTVQIVLYHSIPFLVYKSFGLAGYSILTFIGIQAVLYISVSALPFPGAVGISEGSFMIIYKLLFPAELLSGAMLLSRGISFYIFVLISGICVLITTLVYNSKKDRKNKKDDLKEVIE